MKRVMAIDVTRSLVLAAQVTVADRWWTRLRGLLFRRPLRSGESLLLTPCRAVHTLGMRYPIDVVYLSAEQAIVRLWHSVPPGRRLPWCRNTSSVLELPAQTLAAVGAEIGDLVRFSRDESPGRSEG